MDTFTRTVAGVLVALVLILVLQKQSKEMSLLLTVAVCVMICAAAAQFLEPLIRFFTELSELGELESSILTVMLKAVGIGILAEVTSHICADSGNGAMGKTLQIAASAVILWISIPLFTKLLDLIQNLLVPQ